MELHKIGVAGFGTMGSEIALLAALAGYGVHVYEVIQPVVEKQTKRLAKVLRLLKKDSTDEERSAALARITQVQEPGGLGDCDLVIEAVLEEVDVTSKLLGVLKKRGEQGT